MRRIAAPVALFGALGSGCAPMVTHGPQVQPGVYLGVTGGLGLPADSVLQLVMSPLMSPYVRTGVRLKGGWAGSAAVAVNAGATGGLEADLYAQPPSRSAGWAHGAGLVVAGNYAMPYAQIGRQDEAGAGWYVTQGFAWRGWQDASACLMCGGYPDRVRTRYASTTYTWRRVRGARSVDLYVTGSAGQYDLVEGSSVDTIRSRGLWSIAGGVSLEANLTRLFREAPRPVPGRPPRTPPPHPQPHPIP